MRTELIQAPAAEPLTAADAKAHLRVTTSSEDALITRLIAAARRHVEAAVRRKLITQKWRVYFDYFPGQTHSWPGSVSGSTLYLPPRRFDLVLPDVAPVASVDALKYIDASGVLQTLDPATYQLVAEQPARVALAYGQGWPGGRGDRDGVRVEVTSGYGADGTTVPEDILIAMLLTISHLYDHRSEVSETQLFQIPAGAMNYLSSYIVPAF